MSDQTQPAEQAGPMQRQYVIFYRRGEQSRWGQLEPGVHQKLYERPELAFGIAFMQANPFVEALCIRLGDDLFNIMALVEGNTNSKAFTFDGATTSCLVLPEGE